MEWHGWYVIGNSENDMRELLKIPDNFKVMFLQGGATTQFASVALNLLGLAEKGAKPTVGDCIVTRTWGEKAAVECKKYGTGDVAISQR